jgi:hypothetical protein
MTQGEIEHMWKVASNNPNHDTNWHDPVVVTFAKMVAAHTLMNIDPSSFMSHQEGVEAGRLAEREACLKDLKNVFSTFDSLPASPEITLIKRFCSIFFEAFTVAINERTKP